MPLPVLLITILVLVFFTAAGIYLAVNAKKIRYPGTPHHFGVGDTQVSLIITPPNSAILASTTVYVRRAVQAALDEWAAVAKDALPYEHIAVHITDSVSWGLEGHLTYVSSLIGNTEIPMLEVRQRDIITTAHLIIHEAGHLLANRLMGYPDVTHTNPVIWGDAPGGSADSYEMKAQARFRANYEET